MGTKISVDEFKHRVIAKWGKRWGLDNITELPNGMHSMIDVVCQVHGVFYIKAYSLLQEVGCRQCGVQDAAVAHRRVFNIAKEGAKAHPEMRYDYSHFIYKGMEVKGEIICPMHGSFMQTPHHHVILKQGCPECGKIKCAASNKLDTKWFRERADIVHPENNHSQAVYINTHTPIKIMCPIHGAFMMRPADYLNLGQGCPQCGKIKAADGLRMTREEFIRRASIMPEHKSILYDKVKYTDSKTPVRLTCLIHGEFMQTPDAHLTGQSCPSCTHAISKWEHRLADYTRSLGVDVIQSYRGWCGNREIDIYIPSMKIGFECNGLFYHHSGTGGKGRMYHRDKTIDALKVGIRLYHLWDSTLMNVNKDIIASKVGRGVERVFARKTKVIRLSRKELDVFLNNNHVQGSVGKNTLWRGGLIDGCGRLVAVMSFRRERSYIELSRYDTLSHTVVVGGFSKLLHAFISEAKTLGVKQIVSYANGDLTPDPSQSVYTKCGFILDTSVPFTPTKSFCDIKRSIIYNRRRFAKPVLPHIWHDITKEDMAHKTENRICEEHGIYPLYNSGRWKFVLMI